MAESALASLVDKIDYFIQEETVTGGARKNMESLKEEFSSMKNFLQKAEEMREVDGNVESWVKKVIDTVFDVQDFLDEVTSIPPKNSFSSKIQCLKANYALSSSDMHLTMDKCRSLSTSFPSSSRSKVSHYKWDNQRASSSSLNDKHVVGLDEPRKQLISWLMEGGNSLRVISINGMGGLGKTTLVQYVFNSDIVNLHFDIRTWISVSPSFKIEDILRNMLRELSPIHEEMSEASIDKLRVEIKDILRKKRYLVVLDDVWSTAAWEAIQSVFSDDDVGSRLIITTRNRAVADTASAISTGGEVYAMKPLSPEASLSLFCLKTFQQNSCPPDLEEICRRILRRCQGHPLAIVAISGLLYGKNANKIDEWETICNNLSAQVEGNYLIQSVDNAFSLSYIDLPSYLKPCILYTSVFPEEHSIERMRLIRLWIAQGFVKKEAGKTLEDVAEAYLHELLNRNWIQVAETTSDGRVHTCRIHNVVHEFIIRRSAIYQKLASVSGKKSKRLGPDETIRHLSIHNNLKDVPKGISLYSLLVFGMDNPEFEASLSSLLLHTFKFLRVLDLRGSTLTKLPPDLSKLTHLSYLSLRHTKIKMLPKSIGKLLNLETLDLKHTEVTELPSQVSKLSRLRHLLVYSFKFHDYMPHPNLYACKAPRRIGKLRSLQKLSFVESNPDDGILKELGKLQELRRLGITKLRREDGLVLCSSISKLTHLRSLNIHAEDKDEFIELEHITSPPQFLQRLYLHGRLKKLPSWITKAESLVKVILRWSSLTNFLEPLGNLPNLMELQLREAYQGQVLCFQVKWFKKLKILLLDELEGVKCVCVDKGGLPCLEDLTIMRCHDMDKVPEGIEHLSNLKTVQFLDMPNEIYKSVSNSGESKGDYWKVKHITKLWFTNWRNGRWVTRTI